MIAIISKGDRTAHLQLPVDRKQLAGALSYLGAIHTSDYTLKYNEESEDGLKVSLQCFGVVENAIEKVIPVGFKFYALNDTLSMLDNLPYGNRREIENIIKVDGLESFEQFDKMLIEATPKTVVSKFYCPLAVQLHSCNSWGDVDDEGYEYDGVYAAKYEDDIRQALRAYNCDDEQNMADYFSGNNSVHSKLLSANWDVEHHNGELFGCITVKTAGELTEDEEDTLKDWITGQNSDGFGEGFEQREIHIDGGRRGSFIYVSFWNSDDDYFVDNEEEFESRLNQDITMGGM